MPARHATSFGQMVDAAAGIARSGPRRGLAADCARRARRRSHDADYGRYTGDGPMSAPELSMVDAAAWDEARRCLPVIRRLAENSARKRRDVLAAAAELGYGPTHVYALLRRYLADARLTSLLPRRRGPERGISLLDQEVDALINEVIDNVYLTRQQPRIVHLVDEVGAAASQQVWSQPSRKAITARLQMRPAREVVAKREGRKAARDRYIPAVGSLEAPWPLSLIQIDHTLVDVIVVDSVTRAAHSAAVADAGDRCLHALRCRFPSVAGPAVCDVGCALREPPACLPRRAGSPSGGSRRVWPVRGMLERLHLDNAKEFRSEALKRGCEQYGIAIDYRPVRTPHYGGHIERLIGTMMGKVHLLPGTTFSDVRSKGDSKPDEHRCDDARRGRALARPCDRRRLSSRTASRNRHDAARRLDARSERRRYDAQGVVSRQPVADPRRFLIDFLPITRRLIRREGVFLHSIAYWSDVLRTWIGHPRHR